MFFPYNEVVYWVPIKRYRYCVELILEDCYKKNIAVLKEFAFFLHPSNLVYWLLNAIGIVSNFPSEDYKKKIVVLGGLWMCFVPDTCKLVIKRHRCCVKLFFGDFIKNIAVLEDFSIWI